MLTDTSSAAAGLSARVGGAATRWASSSAEEMFSKSAAANIKLSGATLTCDMPATTSGRGARLVDSDEAGGARTTGDTKPRADRCRYPQ
ncbi:hypothetical protein MPRG_21860 [Mycobacterium paragordonae]|uniref:Uncharacterized protein n=1 Tax=Mycobacterium paragordonae TaxID=1389713 RepID=A0ABQ1C372_9MYCO|nr:hypothetical protein MPRG_21860 [Mycobacterium paragordonae]